MSKGRIIAGVVCGSIVVLGIIIGVSIMIIQTDDSDVDDDNPYEGGEEGDPEPPKKYTDKAGDFNITCSDSWDCIRPNQNTTASWSFEIPGTDYENIAWTIKGEGVDKSGTGASAGCNTSNKIEKGDTYTYTCKGTYNGKTVESTYYLYCLDVWPCSKNPIPGFEGFILITIIGFCSIIVIHRFHKVFKQQPKN